MNRLLLEHEDTAPRRTRYTVWKRLGGPYGFAMASNCCTLSAALQQAQRMELRGYITNNGEKP